MTKRKTVTTVTTGTQTNSYKGKRGFKWKKFGDYQPPALAKMFRQLRAPIPYSTLKKLRWVQNTTLNPGTGATGVEKQLCCNGMFDPGLDGTGQPTGFDQMMVLYDHYYVLASRIKVTFFNEGTVPINVAISIHDSTASMTNIRRALSSTPIKATLTPATGSKDMVTLTKTFYTTRFFNSMDPLGDAFLAGNLLANPSEIATYRLFMANVNNSDDPADSAIQYEIEFIAMFREPKKLPLSS